MELFDNKNTNHLRSIKEMRRRRTMRMATNSKVAFVHTKLFEKKGLNEKLLKC